MKIVDEAKEIKNTVQKQTATYIGAGLGLVAGLAWNDAISSLINYIFPSMQNTVIAKLIYAFIITLIVGVVITYLQRLSSKQIKEGDSLNTSKDQ